MVDETSEAAVVQARTHGRVRLITLNRPHARNALSGDLVEALYAALTDAEADPDVHVIVLTGADPAFCAGVDLKEAAADGAAYFERFVNTDPVSLVGRLRTPVVGAINGATFTGGLELALGCDVLIASERAVFADTHTRVGILPGGGMTARLPYLVGAGWARRMSMTAEVVDAATAQRIGLVTEVVEHERVVERALELAAMIADAAPGTVAAVKKMYTDGAEHTIGHGLAVQDAVVSARPLELDGLDERRDRVIARNKSQLERS